ncbi:hypothetical protein CWI42_051510 [Ordospora colligata]|uniref:Uncharacterized protein n=1 Tax=Ordospora colligata OC4 TaxID=1354746 RepID=A0A0B2UL76_9MICR|nr:uncharacterized protein M896_051560 [Ordospora colligata OC4]KHN69747.1 hypothetical protein M896_051560 [Ordospora colligata OC4]TBU15550.1 hypothetical protein CWI41_051550 [Ordospora colligata]TBU15617.1 hypothetical protein CWI40_051530 [Ordospora colligata]TBU18668.1 hypothetical protein CWI42_051510 [Ordospora colligata]
MIGCMRWNKRSVHGLNKYPKTILVVDMYGTTTNLMKDLVRCQVNGTQIDFEETQTHYSLVIVCNNRFKFRVDNPLSLVDCEIWFSRKAFSLDVFIDALHHYSECEIRNGV